MSEQIQVQGFMSMRLRRKRELAEEIWLFEFERADGGPVPPYAPGAHVTLITPSGARRNYSLCSDPCDTEVYQLGIKAERDGRGASVSMVEQTRVGDLIRISAPDNSFPLVEAPEYLLIAGGIGITPLMSMVRCLKRRGGGLYKLIYLTRSRAQTAFIDELELQADSGQVEIHHDNGDPGSLYDFWPLFEQPRKCHVYCCGPRPLMEEIRAVSGHWSSELIHFEDFASDVQAQLEGDRSFIVRHADTGEAVEVPRDSTILETLRSHGHELPSSCESGTCGTCRTHLLEGEADHRDMVLEDHQRGDCIMICVSRALSPELVLRW